MTVLKQLLINYQRYEGFDVTPQGTSLFSFQEFYKAVNWCSELDGDLSAYSIVQPLNQLYDPIPVGYKHFTVESSTSQMAVAASDVTSSPESVVSIRSVPVEYTDYRLDLPLVVINTQPRQETNRDTTTGRIYCSYSNDISEPINLSGSLIEGQYDSLHNVNQREGGGPPRGPFTNVPAGELRGTEWRPSFLKSSSSKQWVNQVDADLKRCISKEKVNTGSASTENAVKTHV